MKKIFIAAISLGLMLGACTSDQSVQNAQTASVDHAKGQSTVQDDESEQNILRIALGSKDHTTLVAAVQAAEIEDILVNAGPITIFAPTNDAFAALPEGTVENLVKPENKSTLKNILYYHASPGTYKGNLLSDGRQIYQANGDNVKIEIVDGKPTVNGANILATVDASNGVVHVIDQVLLPPEKK